jgi:hypothetical protein
MKKLMFAFGAIACASLLPACSLLYDTAQGNAEIDCKKNIDYADYKACLQRNQKSFEDYESERKKLLEQQKKDAIGNRVK